jgi:MYXO-CTERM domain-containing protein
MSQERIMSGKLPKNIVAALAVAATLSCGAPPAEEGHEPETQPGAQPGVKTAPIINGADAMPGQFPTVVGLLLDAYAPDLEMISNPLKCKRGAGICTGTLIRSDVILTAAHCVTNLLKGQMGIDCPNDPEPPKYTQEVNLIAAAQGGKMIQTKKIVVHPKFAPVMCVNPPSVSNWNDIALVFLEKPMSGAVLQKLPTPAEAGQLLKEGGTVGMVGYGKSKTDDDKSAGTQRFGTAVLRKVGTNEIQIAQMGETQQACQGDSGGPVFANFDKPVAERYQIGVASRLRTQRCPGLLDILNPPKCENGVFYTRVDAYLDWIQKTIETERPNPPEEDMAKPEVADMASAGEADMADGEPEMMNKKGCSCDMGQKDRSGAGAGAGVALLLAGLVARRRRRR